MNCQIISPWGMDMLLGMKMQGFKVLGYELVGCLEITMRDA